MLIAAALAVASIAIVPSPSVRPDIARRVRRRADRPSGVARRLWFSRGFRRPRVVRGCPGVQVFGEFGRLGNVMPPLVETGLAFSRIDVTASAFYGEGGVRLLAAPQSAVSPVRGRDGRGCASEFRRARSRLDDRRAHSCGVEPGRHARSDVRRRRRRAHTGWPAATGSGLSLQEDHGEQRAELVLGIGQDLQSHQVRFGAGVRF